MDRRDIKQIQRLVEVAIGAAGPLSPKLKSITVDWQVYRVEGWEVIKPNIKIEYN